MSADPSSGGSWRYAFELGRAEFLNGNDVSLLVSRKGSSFNSYSFVNDGIIETSKICEFDLVNIHYPRGLGLFGWKIRNKSLRNAKIVSTFHGPWHKETASQKHSRARQLIAYFLQYQTLKKSKSVITLSEHFRKEVLNFKANSHVYTIPPGVSEHDSCITSEKPEINIRIEKTPSEVILVTIRRHVKRTGIDLAIMAMTYLPKNFKLVIIGDGPERKNLENLAHVLEIDARVLFTGYLPEEFVCRYLTAATLMIVPSRALEGFGLVVLEAYSHNVPVVATPVGGLLEAIPSRFHTDYVSKEVSAKSLSEAILSAYRRSLEEKIDLRKYYRNWNAVALDIFKVYQN